MIDHREYDIQRDELRLANEKDENHIRQAVLMIKKIEMDIHKWELQQKKAQFRIDERNKEITWFTEKLDG